MKYLKPPFVELERHERVVNVMPILVADERCSFCKWWCEGQKLRGFQDELRRKLQGFGRMLCSGMRSQSEARKRCSGLVVR